MKFRKTEETKVRNDFNPISRQPNESWKIVFKWVQLLAAHFRTDLSEADISVYCEELQNENPDKLEIALRRCLHECKEFMPKLADIHERIPESLWTAGGKSSETQADGSFIPVSDHLEPFTEKYDLKIYVNEQGQKKVKMVLIPEGQFPARATVAAPSEFISWEDAWEKIKNLAKEKDLSRAARAVMPAPSDVEYIPMHGNQTLDEWALSQDLHDDLPRTAQEIECIRTAQNYGKPRKKRVPSGG